MSEESTQTLLSEIRDLLRVDGQLIFNSIFQIRDAALTGYRLGYVPEDLARPCLSKG